jgi:hypothetical protein
MSGGCKINDRGPDDATHFGFGVGGGVFITKDADGSVTICRHPGENIRAVPDVSIVLSKQQWADAPRDATITKTPGVKRPKATPAPKAKAKR